MRIPALLLFVLGSSAFGQLKFDNPEQTFRAKAQDKAVVAKYRFTNIGKETVKIEDVKTSCGCTTAALSKTEYRPGESGEIEAKFNVGGRTGLQEKAIVVRTSDSAQQPSFLRLVVNIEDPVTIQPEFVLWKIGDQPAAKTIRVIIAPDTPAKIISVLSDNPAIKVEMNEVKPGKEYNLQVTPGDLKSPTGATLLIRTDYPPDNPQTRYAYARVK
ncbi:MAG: DUF1573 domain-containing protein [Verrucomicrobia bacterium]|nr:DUF1573 domain-containing protein [Verrucomicrobiota bacterium]MBV9671463.1 DUF1573 domain-containing protein [Verrucomicrobiota bacterium]